MDEVSGEVPGEVKKRAYHTGKIMRQRKAVLNKALVILREALEKGYLEEGDFDSAGFEEKQKAWAKSLARRDADLYLKGKYIENRFSSKAEWGTVPFVVMKNKGGRFSKYLPVVLDIIEWWVERGYPLNVGLEAAGVPREDYDRWLKLERAGELKYQGLNARMTTAEWRGRSILMAIPMKAIYETKSADLVVKHLAIINPGVFGKGVSEDSTQPINITIKKVGGREEKGGVEATVAAGGGN